MGSDLSLSDLADIPDPFDAGSPGPPLVGPPATRSAESVTRAARHRRRYVAAASALLFEIGWVVFVRRRPDLAGLPASSIALGLLVPLAAFAVALGAVLKKGALGLGLPANSLWAYLLLSPCFFLTVTWIVAPHALHGDPLLFWDGVGRCAMVTAILTLVPLGLGALAFRRAFAAVSILRTAALGIACGALAASTMSLVCPDASAPHLLLGHGAMMFIGGLLGAVVGRSSARA